jgi:hypothetical protein
MAKKAVIGLVSSEVRAASVVEQLQRAGFASSDISILFPDKVGTRDFAHEQHTKAPEGAVAGATAGGAIGGTLGLLAGIGALAIPGVGPLIAAGPIMAALSGVAAGAAAGGLAGALVGMGIPEIEAKQYEGKIKGGNVLVSVHTEDGDQRTRAKQILENGGAADVVTAGEQTVPSKRQGSAESRF